MSDVTVARLGRRIRTLRLERGMTLRDVAEAAGCSKALLSKIETGIVSPPIGTLAKVAGPLGVSIGAFFVEPGEEHANVFFPKNQRRAVRGRLSAENYKYQLLIPGRRRRDMQAMVISADGRTHKFKPLDHSGEQFIYMLKGEMDYVVGDKTFTVHPGDCLYFDARQLHGPKLRKHQVPHYLVVFSNR